MVSTRVLHSLSNISQVLNMAGTLTAVEDLVARLSVDNGSVISKHFNIHGVSVNLSDDGRSGIWCDRDGIDMVFRIIGQVDHNGIRNTNSGSIQPNHQVCFCVYFDILMLKAFKVSEADVLTVRWILELECPAMDHQLSSSCREGLLQQCINLEKIMLLEKFIERKFVQICQY